MKINCGNFQFRYINHHTTVISSLCKYFTSPKSMNFRTLANIHIHSMMELCITVIFSKQIVCYGTSGRKIINSKYFLCKILNRGQNCLDLFCIQEIHIIFTGTESTTTMI